MREIFTDKTYIFTKLLLAAKILLAFALVIFFLPLFILPFFNHPCADDYICGHRINAMGFWPYQFFIYQDWGGRFASIFAGSIFAQHNYLYEHYYLHSLLLVAANILSAFFMFGMVQKYVLHDKKSGRHIIWIALVYTALQFCSLAEPSTYIFWFSSAVTYQLPVILLQLQLALWIFIFNNRHAFTNIMAYTLLPVLIMFINGCNELFIVVQFFLLVLLFLCGAWKQLSKPFLVIIMVLYTATAVIVLLSPGIQSRTAIIESKGIGVALVALGFHMAETLWNIARNPLLWIIVVITYLYAAGNKEQFEHSPFFKITAARRWLLPGLIISFLVVANLAAVAALKGGIIPDRYVNGVISITIMLLLLLAFTEGVHAVKRALYLFSLPVALIIVLTCLAGLLANNYIKDAYKSLVAAPLYDTVMDEREALLKQSSSQHTTVTVKSYDAAMHHHLEDDYGASTKTLYDMVQQKPSFLFFEDDLATGYAIDILQDFYKVDSIIVK